MMATMMGMKIVLMRKWDVEAGRERLLTCFDLSKVHCMIGANSSSCYV